MKESLPQEVSVTAVVDNYLDVFEPSTPLVERAVTWKAEKAISWPVTGLHI